MQKFGYFKGKHVWITGASSGIGASLALAVAAEGARVSLCARDKEKLAVVADRITANGGTAKAFVLDVRDGQQISRIYEELRSALGEVDIVIANAGINQKNRKFEELTPQEVEEILSTNLCGTMQTILCVLSDMKNRGNRGSGHIVGISSLAGYRALPRCTVYGATKAGLSYFLDALRMELRGTSIVISDICPGFVATPALDVGRFPTPFLMTSGKAAEHILAAISSEKSLFFLKMLFGFLLKVFLAKYGFPWIMNLITVFGKWCPNWIYDLVLGYANG